MKRHFACFLFLLSVVPAKADGVLATVSKTDSPLEYFIVANEPSVKAARTVALEQCRLYYKYEACSIDMLFKNSCLAIAKEADVTSRYGTIWGVGVSNSLQEAKRLALAKCEMGHSGLGALKCNSFVAECDGTSPTMVLDAAHWFENNKSLALGGTAGLLALGILGWGAFKIAALQKQVQVLRIGGQRPVMPPDTTPPAAPTPSPLAAQVEEAQQRKTTVTDKKSFDL
jgi:hypothetical protein